MNPEKTREHRFDILRALGLFAVILAHVGPPAAVFQLRNFDVPLLFLISGSVYPLSTASNLSYWRYLFHRISRLIIPTWIFLTIFYLFEFYCTRSYGQPFPYPRDTMISSFYLFSDLDYFWVIRVFILLAALTPIIYKIRQNLGTRRYLAFLIFCYVMYELAVYFYPGSSFSTNPSITKIFQEIIFLVIPYACVAGFGMHLKNFSKKQLLATTILFFLVFVALMFHYRSPSNNWLQTQAFKYPPRLYYLSFALFAGSALYFLSQFNLFLPLLKKILRFIGSNTLWIYLWHILLLNLWVMANFSFPNAKIRLAVEFLTITSVSVCITYLQKIILHPLAKTKYSILHRQ